MWHRLSVPKTKNHPRTKIQLKDGTGPDSPRVLCALIQRPCPDIYNIYMKYTEKYCKLIKFLKRVKFTQNIYFLPYCLMYIVSPPLYTAPSAILALVHITVACNRQPRCISVILVNPREGSVRLPFVQRVWSPPSTPHPQPHPLPRSDVEIC